MSDGLFNFRTGPLAVRDMGDLRASFMLYICLYSPFMVDKRNIQK